MAWRELSVVDQRTEFVLRALHEDVAFAELCREYGISPKTGYKWKSRFLKQGMSGLADRSRRPRSSPSELSESVVCSMVALKQKYPAWGPRKLRVVYGRLHGQSALPSESSFKRVLERCGLTQPRRSEASESRGRLQTRLVPSGPNDLWTVDFKGWWYLGGGGRCQPLTVRDGYSRFILCLQAPADARGQTIREQFERLFERYGLPGAIRSDNGAPFAAHGSPLGLSRLSAWWVALGIDLDRIDPGHPEQNGAHERMHRDVAQELECRAQADRCTQNAALETWRQSFNQERPHEALGMRIPADLYQPSPRRFQGTPQHLTYPVEYVDRAIGANGCLSFRGHQVRISDALAGWNVGLKGQEGGCFGVYFGRLCLGRLDAEAGAFQCWRPEEPAAEATAAGLAGEDKPGAPPPPPGFIAVGTDDGGEKQGPTLQGAGPPIVQ